MPSPQATLEGTVRALSLAMADGRPLEHVRNIIADDSDTTGYNRGLRTPVINVQVASLTRRELDQSWTGEWAYTTDADGNRIQGRVFLKAWQLDLSASVITGKAQGDADPDAARRAIVTRLGQTLSRYDTGLRGEFLPGPDGVPLQDVTEFRDEGGDPYGTSTSARQFERDISIQFGQRVNELDYGGTPTIERVIAPGPGEVHTDPEREGGVRASPDNERVTTILDGL